MRSPNAAKRCLPWAVTSSSTRPSTSAASAKRPCGLVTRDRLAGELAPAGRGPGGAACDPRASVRSPAALPTRARGSAAAAKRAARLDDDGVGVPEAGVERRGDVDGVAAVGETGAPRRGRVALDDDGRRAAARPRVEPGARTAQRPARRRDGVGRRRCRGRTGGPRAAAGSAAGRRRPSSRTPPPARRRGSPSPGTACAAAGAPGRYSAGGPAARLKPRPRLCRLMPVVGSTSQDPKPEALDWIRLTASPVASAVHRYVVSPAAAANGRRPARSEVDAGRPGPRSRRAGRRRRRASWSTSGRSNPAVAAASTSRWAHCGSSGSAGTPTCVGEARRRRASGSPASSGRSSTARRRTPCACSGVDPVGLRRGQVVVGEVAVAEGEQALAERAAVERRRARRRRSPAGPAPRPAGAPARRVAWPASTQLVEARAGRRRRAGRASRRAAGWPGSRTRRGGSPGPGRVARSRRAEALVERRSSRRRSRARSRCGRRGATASRRGPRPAGRRRRRRDPARPLALSAATPPSGRADEGEQVAAQPAQVGGGDGDGGVGGDRRVDGVAAAGEHGHRRLGGELVGGGGDRVEGADGARRGRSRSSAPTLWDRAASASSGIADPYSAGMTVRAPLGRRASGGRRDGGRARSSWSSGRCCRGCAPAAGAAQQLRPVRARRAARLRPRRPGGRGAALVAARAAARRRRRRRRVVGVAARRRRDRHRRRRLRRRRSALAVGAAPAPARVDVARRRRR